jgi:uncharacterized membrane protein
VAQPELISSIQASLGQGKTPEQIYLELLQQGHTVKEIQEAFETAEAKLREPESQKRMIALLLIIGAFLVGAGVFSFIAANWQVMSRSSKLSVIILAMLGAYTSGWYLRERSSLTRTGNALILLGSIIYGGGIFLIGQIFHVRSNWPDGFILWMLGVIPMALAVRLRSLLALALIVGAIGLGAHPFGIFEAMKGYERFLLTSSFLLLAAAVSCLGVGVIMRKRALSNPEGTDS